MRSNPSPDPADLPDYDEESGAGYSLEVIAELAGVDTRTVLLYQEKGLLNPAPRHAGQTEKFDTEALRQIRRIEHLRDTCGTNETGLRLILGLLHEVERLRQERRQRWR